MMQPIHEASTSPTATKRRSGCLPGCLWALVALVALIVGVPALVGLVMVIAGFATVDGLFARLGSVFSFGSAPPTASVVAAPSIVRLVQEIGTLETVQADFAKANIEVNMSQSYGALDCSFWGKYVAEGTIEAGVNIAGLGEGDITIDPITGVTTLRLPPPQLTGCSIGYIEQYTSGSTAIPEVTCNRDWDGLRRIAEYTALTDFRTDAIEGGILERTQRQAALVMANLLSLSLDAPVNIEFASPPEGFDPYGACHPAQPLRWEFDAERNTWIRTP
jgi:hypothetical protein